MLLAKSTDGGQSFATPVVVSNFYELPDCLTYQGSDPGRACVPEKGPSTNSVFRAANYPSGAVNPKNPSQVVVTLGSYINQDSKEPGCTPAGWNPSTLSGAVQRRQDGDVQQRHPRQRLEQRRRDVHGDGGGPADRADGEPRPGPGEDRPVLAVGGVRQAAATSASTTTTASTASRPARRRCPSTSGSAPPTSRSRGARATTRSGARSASRRRRCRRRRSSRTRTAGAVLRRLHRDGRLRPGDPDLVRHPRPGALPLPGRRRAADSAPARTRTRPATSSQTTRRSTPRRCSIPGSGELGAREGPPRGRPLRPLAQPVEAGAHMTRDCTSTARSPSAPTAAILHPEQRSNATPANDAWKLPSARRAHLARASGRS